MASNRDTTSVVSVKNTADAALRRLGSKARPIIARALRHGAGVIASATRAELLRAVPTAGRQTATGAFRGQAMTDSVWVKADDARLCVKTLLNRGRDARLDWLDNGTAQRFNVRTRNLHRRSGGAAPASRGRIAPLHFFENALARSATRAYSAMTASIEAGIDNETK